MVWRLLTLMLVLPVVIADDPVVGGVRVVPRSAIEAMAFGVSWQNNTNAATKGSLYDELTAEIEDARLPSALARDAEVAAGYQPLDADLTTIAAFGSTGLPARTGDGTWAFRTITAGNGMSLADGNGVSGNPTVTWEPSLWTSSTMTIGDSSQSSLAITFGLSGATDPTIMAGNNSLAANVPLSIPDGSVTTPGLNYSSETGTGWYRRTTGIIALASGGADGGVEFGSSIGGIRVRSNGNYSFSSSTSSSTGRDTYIQRASAGNVKVTTDGTVLGGLTAGTLTLTPASADTTAVTVSGGSTTGSGTTPGETFAWTWNTSGAVIAKRNVVTDTASAAGSFHETWENGSGIVAGIGKGSGASGVAYGFGAANYGLFRSGTSIYVSINGTTSYEFGGAPNFSLHSAAQLSWAASGSPTGSKDTLLLRDAAATLQMGVDASAAVAQTLKAHDGTGTDITGASLSLAGGQGTGTGKGGAVIVKTSPSGSTGTSANAYSERAHWIPKAVTLTESTATTVATIAVPSAKFVGGSCTITVFASDATDHQARTLTFPFSAINKAGTVTAGLGTPVEGVAVSSGTLTATITTVANGNAIDIKVDATSSLTQTTLNATVSIPAINSNDTAAVTEI